MTALVTDMNLSCDNTDCGHTFVAQIVIVRTVSTSACPRPGLVLPIAPPRAPMRRRAPANDNDAEEVRHA